MVYHLRELALSKARDGIIGTTRYRLGLRYTRKYYKALALKVQCFCAVELSLSEPKNINGR